VDEGKLQQNSTSFFVIFHKKQDKSIFCKILQ